MVVDCSLNVIKFSDCLHKSADTHGVGGSRSWVTCVRVGHQLLGSVVHGIELSNLVAETDAVEEAFDLFAGTGELEIVLTDAQLGEGRGEQDVNGLGLVTIVL